LSWKKKLSMLLLAAGVVSWWLFGSKCGLEVTNYVLSTPKIAASVRIVQLSDLHNSEFDKDNIRLVELVRKQRPDLILLTGDMLNSDKPDTDVVRTLLGQLTEIAPVYASLGNHESEHKLLSQVDIRALYEDAGAILLEREYADAEVKGQRLRIGGVMGYCLAEKYLRTGEARREEIDYLKVLQDTDRLTILLCHMPLCWIVNDNLEQWNIDCIFSGHAHGGQVRLPLVGGVYAPDQGYFPGQLCGLYASQDGERVMVLSRGLGSRGGIPRINNVPEIVVVDILPRMK